MADATARAMTTADGMPLKLSLHRALFRSRIRAFLLVTPLLAFLTVAFILPIFDMLFRGVENQIVEQVLPRTVAAIQGWEATGDELPPEARSVPGQALAAAGND